MTHSQELVFVHLGNSLPRYAQASLALASRTSGLTCRLLASQRNLGRINVAGVRSTPIDSFYDPSAFLSAYDASLSSKEFREGFWQKSLERFFVLEQFMASNDINSLLHAELDQLVFRADILLSKLNELPNTSVFLPFHDSTHALGSIVAVRSREALSDFLRFAGSGRLYWNEMELLAKFALHSPTRITAFPTVVNWYRDNPNFLESVDSIPITAIHGVTDAAQLGQWLGGIDPKNVPIGERPKNKFADRPSDQLLNESELRKLSFRFEEESASLFACVPGLKSEVRVYNLHLHSKIHRTIVKSRGGIGGFFHLVEKSGAISFFEARTQQLRSYIIGYAKVFRVEPKYALERFLAKPLSLLSSRWGIGGSVSFSSMGTLSRSSKQGILGRRGRGVICLDHSRLLDLQREDSPWSPSLDNQAIIFDFSGKAPTESEFLLMQHLSTRTTVAAVSANGPIPSTVHRLPRGQSRLREVILNYEGLLRMALNSKKVHNFGWSFDPVSDCELELAQALYDTSRAKDLRFLRPRDYIIGLSECRFHVFSSLEPSSEELIWETMRTGTVPVLPPSPISSFYQISGFPVIVTDKTGDLLSKSNAELNKLFLSTIMNVQTDIFSWKLWLSRLGFPQHLIEEAMN